MKYATYREILNEELVSRKSNNARYSLRAFARDCSVLPSMLAEVLSRKKNFSLESGRLIAQRLGFDTNKEEMFCLLLEFETAKNIRRKADLQEKIFAISPACQQFNLSLEKFKLIGDWYHLAILQLTRTANFKSDSAYIAKRLGISTSEVQSALDRLIRLNLIKFDERSKKYTKTTGDTLATSKVPNEALRAFHRKMGQLAEIALEQQLPAEKIVGSETIALDSSQIEEAREIAEVFFQKILALSKKKKNPREVYHLSVNCFRLTKSIAEDCNN